MLKDKILNIVVTRNNPVLLKHIFDSFNQFNPGYDCDFLIVDNSSDDAKHLKVLELLSKDNQILTVSNNRVEASFNEAWKRYRNQYQYYYFMHDDCCANRDNWLKVYIDRMNSLYYEQIIKTTHLKDYKIGKVGALSHFWRSFTTILNYPVQCVFLKDVLDILRPNHDIKIFKYVDCDRTMISNECLESTNGLRNISEFKDLEVSDNSKFNDVCNALEEYLRYYDEGIAPKDIYPPGKFWNRFTLLAEMMNSIDPLLQKYRTVGLENDGYLEAIHGSDIPMCHNYVHHYGSPNFKEFIAKKLNADVRNISNSFNNKIFLITCDKLLKEYFGDK